MSGITPDAIYTVAEVAVFLRCGKSTVYSLAGGDLAVTKVGVRGGGIRVKGSDILAFLDSRKDGGPSLKTYKHLGRLTG